MVQNQNTPTTDEQTDRLPDFETYLEESIDVDTQTYTPDTNLGDEDEADTVEIDTDRETGTLPDWEDY